MKTVTIKIPGEAADNVVEPKKDNISYTDEDEDLTADELEQLKRGLKQALLIKAGKLKSIPFSELWDD